MNYVLCICLCAASLLLAAVSSSLLCSGFWLMLRPFTHSWPARRAATVIFFLRIFPACFSLLFTFGLALPAFLLKEPQGMQERVSAHLGVLALLGMLLAGVVLTRVVLTWMRVRELRNSWIRSGRRMEVDGCGAEVFEVTDSRALIAVTGVFRPKVFLSREVVSSLDANECRAGIAHEIAHISAFDNLKHLLLQALYLPALEKFTGLDTEWQVASEVAADNEALRNGTPVIDLASALVKVARLRLAQPAVTASALYLASSGKDSLLSIRIAHLMARLEPRDVPLEQDSQTSPARVWAALALSLLAVYVIHPHLFALTHELLEKMV